MKKKSTIMTASDYAEIFYAAMQEGVAMTNSKGEALPFLDGEKWSQCYKDDDPVRSQLPISWFVSDKSGNVVSCFSGKPEWLLNDSENPTTTPSYHFYLNGRIKHIKAHALTAIVHGSERFGNAGELLDEKGLYAFGIKDKPDNVQTHHISRQKSCPEHRFDADNMMLMTVQAHNTVHAIPAEDASDDKKAGFMERLKALADDECGDKLVIAVRDGDKTKLTTADKLTPEQVGRIRCAMVYLDNEEVA
ncbi:MAG: hypothetical protein IJT05_07850 [Lachnospiraceae bacterium]|nr:hypothetical protein [Lachnospiraceae bacterium]